MTYHTSEMLVQLLTAAVSAAAMEAWTGWWLNTGSGVMWTLALLFLLAVLLGSRRRCSLWAGPVALWAGAMTGLTISLFLGEPGTIWPIVLVISSALTAGAIMAGTSVRWVWTWLCGGCVQASKRSGAHVDR